MHPFPRELEKSGDTLSPHVPAHYTLHYTFMRIFIHQANMADNKE